MVEVSELTDASPETVLVFKKSNVTDMIIFKSYGIQRCHLCRQSLQNVTVRVCLTAFNIKSLVRVYTVTCPMVFNRNRLTTMLLDFEHPNLVIY